MSIRIKIILILIAFIVIPGVIFSALVYSTARKALVDVRIAQLNNIALLKKERIETFFSAWKADIASVQHNPDIKRYLPVLTDHGKRGIPDSYAEALGEIEEQLRALLADYGYLSVALTDARGNVVYAVPGGRIADGRKLSAGVEFFEDARKGVYFSDVYRRPSAEARFAMIGAAPVHDRIGTFVGELVIEHDMGPIYGFVSDSTGLGDTGEVVISRREGDSVLFLSPLKRDSDAALKKKASFDEAWAEPAQRAVRGETGSGVSLDYAGKEVLAAWQYIPFLRWGLVTKIDMSEALAPVIRLRNLIILVTVVVLSIGVLASIVLAKGVSEPILELQKGTAVIGRGNLDHKVGTAAKDEVGQLSRLIDSMTDSLKKVMASRDELNAEIEVRRRAEEAASRLNRLYAILSKVNETIVRVNEPKELYERVCQIAVEDGSFKMAWIGLVDPATKQVRPVVSCGDDGGYLDGLDISAADVREGNGPTGTAIRENRNVICGDIEHDSAMLVWHERALRNGFRSSASFPLRSNSSIVGAMTIYSGKPNSFTDEEMSLLSALADDISFATESMATERRRREAAERTRLTNALLKLFAQKVTWKEYLDEACVLIREWSGLRHVGIRITVPHGAMSFAASKGYSESFRDAEQEITRTEDPCVCARIISGKPAVADRRAMTPGGSFYSGNAVKFVEDLRDDEQALYRGVCMKHGYASVAVVPIGHRDSLIGSIHLADERRGMLSPAKVEFLEHLALIIGESVYRFGMEDEVRRNFGALQASEARYRTLVDDVRDIIFTISPEGTIMSVNPAFQALTGLAAKDWIGRHFTALVHPADVPFSQEVFGAILAGHAVPLFEVRVLARDGDYRHFEFKITSGRTADGMILGTARDVTERKQAEEERARLVSAIESAPEAVVITAPSTGVILYVNPAFEQLTGYAKEESLGRTLHFLDSGKDGQDLYAGLRESLAQTGVWNGRLTNRKKNGSIYSEECTISPVRNGSGEIINYVYIKRDVTEKLRLESIAESVSMMDNIGSVFAGVRHEIGNPINSMNMILGILRAKLDGLSPDEVRNYLDRMSDQVARVEYILRSLKSFNLYETQVRQNIEVASFLENFLPLVRDDFLQRGIAIDVSVAPGVRFMHADPRALQQVLLNILTNAADALSGREDPRVLVHISEADGQVIVRVQDNGAGIAEGRLKDIFRPFYTTKPSGTGLGLVIVRKMLAQMNGSIDVQSREGEGTTVTVALPEEKG